MKYIFLMLSLFGTMVVGVKAGKMYTPIGRNNKVACIAEHLKKVHYLRTNQCYQLLLILLPENQIG